jgi:hypothetical protein
MPCPKGTTVPRPEPHALRLAPLSTIALAAVDQLQYVKEHPGASAPWSRSKRDGGRCAGHPATLPQPALIVNP